MSSPSSLLGSISATANDMAERAREFADDVNTTLTDGVRTVTDTVEDIAEGVFSVDGIEEKQGDASSQVASVALSAPESASQIRTGSLTSQPWRAALASYLPASLRHSIVMRHYGVVKSAWGKVIAAAFKVSKPIPVGKPQAEKLDIVRWSDLEDGSININNLFITSNLPQAEISPKIEMVYASLRRLTQVMPLTQPDLPRLPDDAEAALDMCFPDEYAEIMTRPTLPQELRVRSDDPIGALSLSGPFAAYIQADAMHAGMFTIDLSKFEGVGVHAGLEELGCKVSLRYNADAKQMDTVHIERAGEIFRPGESQWPKMQRLALCSLSTDMTLVRHLVNSHIIMAGTFAAVSMNELPPKHPLRAILHPHLNMTLATNLYKIKNLIQTDSGALPNFFSYSRETLHELMDVEATQFDIRSMDPVADAHRRGLFDVESNSSTVAYPYLDNVKPIFDAMLRYANNFVVANYPTDEAIQQDGDIKKWLVELDRYIPGGVMQMVEFPINRAGVARLLATFMYTVSVEHENVGNTSWNYTTFHTIIPPVVPTDGGHPPLDISQRYINTNMLTFLPCNKLMADYSELAPNAESRASMQEFQAELAAIQTDFEALPAASWRIMPQDLEVSVGT